MTTDASLDAWCARWPAVVAGRGVAKPDVSRPPTRLPPPSVVAVVIALRRWLTATAATSTPALPPADLTRVAAAVEAWLLAARRLGSQPPRQPPSPAERPLPAPPPPPAPRPPPPPWPRGRDAAFLRTHPRYVISFGDMSETEAMQRHRRFLDRMADDDA